MRTAASNGHKRQDLEGKMYNSQFDDDRVGTESVPLISRVADAVLTFVNKVFGWCLAAGFSRSNPCPPIVPSPPARAFEVAAANTAHVSERFTATEIDKVMSTQEAYLQQATDCRTIAFSAIDAVIDGIPPIRSDLNPADTRPYLLELRSGLNGDLPDAKAHALNSRWVTTNAAVALTDIGRASHYLHPAVQRIADDFGLNRKYHAAFYPFGSRWLSRSDPLSVGALRLLYIGDDAGTGKSHVLREIKVLIKCPVLPSALAGRLLTVASQENKRLAWTARPWPLFATQPLGTRNVLAIEMRAHSQSLTADRKLLPANKTVHWQGSAVLAIEEVSIVICDLMLALQKAACAAGSIRLAVIRPHRRLSWRLQPAQASEFTFVRHPSSQTQLA